MASLPAARGPSKKGKGTVRLRIRHYFPLVVGALSLALAVLAFLADLIVAAAGAAATFGVILLALTTHIHVRAGSNYRQLLAEHERLLQQSRAVEALVRHVRDAHATAHFEDEQLLEVMDRMTPIITETVARDWSVNAGRITARYEVIEADLHQLLEKIEMSAAEQGLHERRRDVDQGDGSAQQSHSHLGE